MRVAVVGASGLLGRTVVPMLQGEGHDVLAVVRSPAAAQRLGAVTTSLGDVWDAGFLAQSFVGCDAVVMIATAIPPPSRMAVRRAWRTNDRIRSVLAPAVVAAARSAGVRRVVQESIYYVYADAGDAIVDERAAVDPSPNVATALVAEDAVARFGHDGGEAVILRFAQFVARESVHTRAVLRTARLGWSMMLGPADAYQAFVHVADAATAVAHGLGVPAGTYNVGARPETNVRLARTLQNLVRPSGSVRRIPESIVRMVPGSEGITRSIRLDSTELTAQGWQPRFPDVHSVFAAALT